MKKFALLATVFASQIAFSAPQKFQLESKIFVDGKLISSPRVIANANESAEITQKSESPKSELRMKVVASDMTNAQVKNGILMKFEVSYLANGRTIKSSPQILAKAGQLASIEVGKDDGTPAMKIEVTATRQ